MSCNASLTFGYIFIFVISEIEQLNLFYLNVEVAEPFVNVSVVFLFDVFKLVS